MGGLFGGMLRLLNFGWFCILHDIRSEVINLEQRIGTEYCIVERRKRASIVKDLREYIIVKHTLMERKESLV